MKTIDKCILATVLGLFLFLNWNDWASSAEDTELNGTTKSDEMVDAFLAPPKQPVGQIYSIEEIKNNYGIRELMQAVEVETVGFGFDSASVDFSQAHYLLDIGKAILAILKGQPDATFFVEGHADAPGSDIYNLRLSERRAIRVKAALVEIFKIPEMNIIATGFGEKHPRVQTDERAAENRRVTVRNVTPLIKARHK